MAVNIQGLSDNARRTAMTGLNARRADAIAHSAAIKQAHWHVKGRNFIAVHELFDTVFGHLQGHADTMAERIQVLDGVAGGADTADLFTSASGKADKDLWFLESHLE